MDGWKRRRKIERETSTHVTDVNGREVNDAAVEAPARSTTPSAEEGITAEEERTEEEAEEEWRRGVAL